MPYEKLRSWLAEVRQGIRSVVPQALAIAVLATLGLVGLLIATFASFLLAAWWLEL